MYTSRPFGGPGSSNTRRQYKANVNKTFREKRQKFFLITDTWNFVFGFFFFFFNPWRNMVPVVVCPTASRGERGGLGDAGALPKFGPSGTTQGTTARCGSSDGTSRFPDGISFIDFSLPSPSFCLHLCAIGSCCSFTPFLKSRPIFPNSFLPSTSSRKMNSNQQMQRVSELRMRRWGRSGATASASISSSELELSLRSSSLNTSFSTSETICETTTNSSISSTRERRGGGSFTTTTTSSESPVNFEFCRTGSGNGQTSVYHQGGNGSSRAASPLLAGSSPCPSPTAPRSPRSPMTPRSPRSPRSPCRSPSSQLPSPGHHTPSSSPHRYSSRRRSGAATGNLARLASRRSSRDSEAGEPTPLQCVRNQGRRTSNFLEIPGEFRPLFLEWIPSLPAKRGPLHAVFTNCERSRALSSVAFHMSNRRRFPAFQLFALLPFPKE